MFEIRQRDTGELVDQHRHDQTRGVDDEGPQLLGGGPVAGKSDNAIAVVGEQAAQDVTDCPADQGVCPGGFEEVHGAEVDGGTDDSHDAQQHHCPGVFRAPARRPWSIMGVVDCLAWDEVRLRGSGRPAGAFYKVN